MGKPTKAQIKYQIGEGKETSTTTLRFHAVIFEEHEASNEITQFPVQSGFNISNHAIRHNRKVSVSGIVSNHLIIGAEEFHRYGGNNSRIMFSALQELILNATPCEVNTNLGDYSPVIWNRIKTKQQAGETDILRFTLYGQEVQLGLSENRGTPALLEFTPLTSAERAAMVAELLKVGTVVPDAAVISKTKFVPGDSFQLEITSPSGAKSVQTCEAISEDTTSKLYNYNLHVGEAAVAVAKVAPAKFINWYALTNDADTFALPNVNLQAGASAAVSCLIEGAFDLAADFIADLVDTAVGKLTKSAYGYITSTLGLKGDEGWGQNLISLGVECFVVGAIGSVLPPPQSDIVDAFPTADDVLEGAKDLGSSAMRTTLGSLNPVELVKISPPEGVLDFFGDIL